MEEYGTLNPASGMATRSTFLIDPSGKIVKVWPQVNPQGHSTEVLAALEELEKK